MLNSGYNFSQFWDGRAATLEAQINEPIQSKTAMGSSWNEVVGKLRKSAEYVQAFREIYGGEINVSDIRTSLADFERSLSTPDSRFDRQLIACLDTILKHVLLYELTPHSELSKPLDKEIAWLADHFPAHPEVRATIEGVIAHAKTIIRVKPRVEATIETLQELPFTTALDHVSNEYFSTYENAQLTKQVCRLLLYCCSVLLFAYCAERTLRLLATGLLFSGRRPLTKQRVSSWRT